jgi:hypothetical protein
MPIIVRSVNNNSDRDLVGAFHRAAPAGSELIYRTRPAFSSAFYTQGTLRYVAPDVAMDGTQPRYEVIDREDAQREKIASDSILFNGSHRILVERK